MGLRGPQRKPTEIGLLSGSTRAKARARTAPDIGYSVPDPPDWLRASSLPYWHFAISQVGHLRCITESDCTQLAILADALCDYAECQQTIEREGAYLTSEKGGQYPHPATNRINSVYGRIKDCLDRFGLNPSNRSKVIALNPKLGEIEKLPTEKKSRYAD